jgi:hypothetical protein
VIFIVSSVRGYQEWGESVLPDILVHANLDILSHFIILTYFSIDAFCDHNRFESSKAKDNTGSEPAGEDGDTDLDCVV